MYAEALRAMTGRMLASSIMARLAAATTATGMRRRSDLLRVATWQLDAGVGDPDLLRRAATETRRAGDMGGTARLAAGAWDLRPDTDVAILLGTALGFSGRFEEADAIFAAGEELAADDATLARIAIVHAAILSAGLGQPHAGIALLTQTEERVAGEAELAILRAQRAHLLALSGEVEASLALSEPIIANRVDDTAFVGGSMAAIIALQMAGAYADRPIAVAAIPDARRLWASGDVRPRPRCSSSRPSGQTYGSGTWANSRPAS